MKIIFIVHQFYPEHYSGTEKFIYNLATMSSLAGNNVKVLSYSFYDRCEYDKEMFNIGIKKITYHKLNITKIRKLINEDEHYVLSSTSNWYKFACTFLYNENPDIIHFGHMMRVFEFAHAAKRLNIPYYITLTDFFLLCPKVNLITTSGRLCNGPQNGEACAKLCPELNTEFIQTRLKLARDSILKNAKKLFAPSQFVANIFKHEMPWLDIDIINHGIVLERGKNNKGVLRNDKKEIITVLYAGSFNTYKGVHVLIDAFCQSKSNKLQLKIYGFGSDQQYFEEIMKKIEGESRCEYCGSYDNDQVGAIMAQADVLVVPSLCYETYSLAMHEALQSGIPVIASNLGALAEKIKHKFNGFLFDPGNVDILTSILDEIAGSPELLDSIKSNIKKMMIPTIEQEALAYERNYVRDIN